MRRSRTAICGASPCRTSSPTRTCSRCLTSRACRCTPPSAMRTTRSSSAAARRSPTPGRWRRSSTPSSSARSRTGWTSIVEALADGREARLGRSGRPRRLGARARSTGPARAPGLHGVLGQTSRDAPARPGARGGARPRRGRGDARLHGRLPLLPGRHVVPAGARAAGRAGGRGRRPAARRDRLRRGLAGLTQLLRLLRGRGGAHAHPRAAPGPARLAAVAAHRLGGASAWPASPPTSAAP